MCGKVVEISDISGCTYFIKEYGYNWTDEMFDDSYNHEKSILSEEMIKDIAEVIKKHNLGVSISENDGKLIIEPLKKEDKEDLTIETPVMVANNIDNWYLRYYAGKEEVYIPGGGGATSHWKYIIAFDRFNPNEIGESLKYNIVK